MIRFTAEDDAVTFTIRAQPRASKSVIVGEVEGALKVRLAAPPVDGAANEELIRLLAAVFAVPRRAVTILSGATAKNKIVRLAGLNAAQFVQILQQEIKEG
ncbi:MAG: DUF167 domain-containing protein [Blastocatellia bacterium]